MKISCKIVQDLLPMYQDRALSEESRLAVKEHLKTCSACRAYRKSISGENEQREVPVDKASAPSAEGARYLHIAKRLRKQHRIRIALLAAAGLLAVGMAVVAIVVKVKSKNT